VIFSFGDMKKLHRYKSS